MTKSEFGNEVKGLPCGKRLPNAHYFLRDFAELLTPGLQSIVRRAAELHGIGNEFNIIKFNTESFSISFLSYPAFWEDPHPTLSSAVLVDLLSGRAKRQEFSERSNPPILHRKETFLPQSHPARDLFARLTLDEEAAGLYEQPTTIGFRNNWTRLLETIGLTYDGHTLLRVEPTAPQGEESEGQMIPSPIPIDRHRTAISRLDLSRPVKTALESGLIEPGHTFFDYGCGQGEDVAGLDALGFAAYGWDPVHRPEGIRCAADVVNLGYVLNVIEDPAERVETLAKAWDLAQRALIVTALTKGTVQTERARAFGDGVVTQRNTFQKTFDHTELQFIVEEALGTTAVPLGLGMFAVFRDVGDREDFFERKSQRSFDWQVVAQRLRTETRVRSRRITRDIYDENTELLNDLWRVTIALGRPPLAEEYIRSGEVKIACGSLKCAHRLLVDRFGEGTLQEAANGRREDLLVYLALAKFGARRVTLNQMSPRLRRSISAFFSTYNDAAQQATELLYTAGDVSMLERAVQSVDYGWYDEAEAHFSFHRSLLDDLPPVLRIYVGCASQLYGDVREADVVKIHLRSKKLTCMYYESFERRRFPRQLLRVKIDFGRLAVQEFPAPEAPRRTVLLFKERFLAKQDSGYERMAAVSRRVRQLGITEQTTPYGMDESSFREIEQSL